MRNGQPPYDVHKRLVPVKQSLCHQQHAALMISELEHLLSILCPLSYLICNRQKTVVLVGKVWRQQHNVLFIYHLEDLHLLSNNRPLSMIAINLQQPFSPGRAARCCDGGAVQEQDKYPGKQNTPDFVFNV